MSTATPQRFIALDVFRGMTICLMIVVNTGGGDPTFSFSNTQNGMALLLPTWYFLLLCLQLVML